MSARFVEWLRANPGRLTAAALSLLALFGSAASPELRDWLLSAAPWVNRVLLGG